jgi:hypothetical protein
MSAATNVDAMMPAASFARFHRVREVRSPADGGGAMSSKFVWLLAVTVATMLTASCVRRVDIEVPENYEGPVVIVFESAEGVEIRRGLIRSVYRIPTDGVLRLRSEAPAAVRPRFWYVKPDGSRIRLPDGRNGETSISVYGFGAVGGRVTALGFVVSTAKDRDKWMSELGKRVHRLTS